MSTSSVAFHYAAGSCSVSIRTVLDALAKQAA